MYGDRKLRVPWIYITLHTGGGGGGWTSQSLQTSRMSVGWVAFESWKKVRRPSIEVEPEKSEVKLEKLVKWCSVLKNLFWGHLEAIFRNRKYRLTEAIVPYYGIVFVAKEMVIIIESLKKKLMWYNIKNLNRVFYLIVFVRIKENSTSKKYQKNISIGKFFCLIKFKFQTPIFTR